MFRSLVDAVRSYTSPKPQETFGDLIAEFWRCHWSLTATSRQVDSIIRMHLRPTRAAGACEICRRLDLSQLRVDQISRRQVFEWHAAHRESPRVANRALRYARQAWSELKPDILNPFEKVKPHPERERTRRLTDDERTRWAASWARLRGTRITEEVADALWVARCTLLRKGEVMALRRDQIDLVAEVAVFDDHKTDDTAGARTVYLGGCIDVIRERCRLCDESGGRFLFPSKRSASGHVENIHDAFHMICDDAGIVRTRDLVPHMLRGDGATVLTEEGTHPRVIQEMLGHSDPSTTARYTRATEKGLRAAASQIHQRLGRMPNKEAA